MTKYLTRSAEILNQVDRLGTQMAWLLFVAEQEALLNAEGYWQPGDPLYKRPNGGDQQTIRPMFQLLESTQFHNNNRVVMFVRCKECEVYWLGDEPCWVCGGDAIDSKAPWIANGLYLGRRASLYVMQSTMLYSILVAFYRRLYEIVANNEARETLVNAASRLHINELTIHSHYDIDQMRYSVTVKPPRDFECPEELNELFAPFYIDRADLVGVALNSPADRQLQQRTPPLPERFEPGVLVRVLGNISRVPYHSTPRDSENEDGET